MSVSKLALTTRNLESSGSSEGSDDSSGSGCSGSTSESDSVLVSSSVATSLSNDTAPTSVASVSSVLGKMSLTNLTSSEPCTCTCNSEADVEQEAKSQPPTRPTPGPSLLSQTAPPKSAVPTRSSSRCSLHPDSPSISHPPSDPSSSRAGLPADQPAALPPPLPISIKIADLGNATPTRKHYTEDIQTRQYRAPEAIVGRTDWGATADMWSVACVLFELLTAEYLFDPQSQGDLFGKDDDHVAQIIELLGEYGETKWNGRYSRELFDSSGESRGPFVCFLTPSPRRGGLYLCGALRRAPARLR